MSNKVNLVGKTVVFEYPSSLTGRPLKRTVKVEQQDDRKIGGEVVSERSTTNSRYVDPLTQTWVPAVGPFKWFSWSRIVGYIEVQ